VESLLKQAFLSRRKMLRNTLAGVTPVGQLTELAREAGIDLQQRPQDVAPACWVSLARGLNRAVSDG
jgi:16S rRNA (adenine1518-N6/adenine1519-N6)-dimethyltransferase